MTTLALTYRNVKGLDDEAIPFVLNSWLKSYRWSERDNPEYYKDITPVIKRLIGTSRLTVARLAEEPDCFAGWICGRLRVLHYCYVKSAFRRDGIARDMIYRVCGPYGSYTFKSKNQSFLRYLDEKGYEYDEKQRDQANHSKTPRAAFGKGDTDATGLRANSRQNAGTRPGRGDGAINNAA